MLSVSSSRATTRRHVQWERTRPELALSPDSRASHMVQAALKGSASDIPCGAKLLRDPVGRRVDDFNSVHVDVPSIGVNREGREVVDVWRIGGDHTVEPQVFCPRSLVKVDGRNPGWVAEFRPGRATARRVRFISFPALDPVRSMSSGIERQRLETDLGGHNG